MSGAAGATVTPFAPAFGNTSPKGHSARALSHEEQTLNSTSARLSSVKLEHNQFVLQWPPSSRSRAPVVARRANRVGPHREQRSYLMSAKGAITTLPTPLPSGEDINATHAEVFTGLSLEFSRITTLRARIRAVNAQRGRVGRNASALHRLHNVELNRDGRIAAGAII